MPHMVYGVRPAEATRYKRQYSRRNFTQAFQELQHEDARVVGRLRDQKQLSNKLRRFLAAAESRDYDYKSLFHEHDSSQVQGFGQNLPSPHSSSSPLPKIKPYGGHSRKKYQKHYYALTRLQKKLHASEQHEKVLTSQLTRIHGRTEWYRLAWRHEQVKFCDPIYRRAPLPYSQYQRQQAIGRRDSGTSRSPTDKLIELAIGAVKSAAMYGTSSNQSWQELLLPLTPTLKSYDSSSDSEDIPMDVANRSHRFSGATLAPSSDYDLGGLEVLRSSKSSPTEKPEGHAHHGIFDGSQPLAVSESVYRANTELETLTRTLNRHAELSTKLRASHEAHMRATLAAEDVAGRLAAAQPVQERYDEVAAGNSKSRRRLNRSYSTDDLENVRRYNERLAPEGTRAWI